jgi:large subunit ribosomal protein L21
LYAVIRTGGKQYKVAEGDVIEIERVGDASDVVEFTPLLVVDDDGVTHSGKAGLTGSRVRARVISESKGPKVDVYKFRNKTGYRRHTGHRQSYSSVEISGISLTEGESPPRSNTKGNGDGT